MQNILTQLNNIYTSKINDVVELLHEYDKTSELSNDEWNEVLSQASIITAISVESLLEKLNEKIAYEQWLENEAEEQYQIMMGTEDIITGCDPYPEY